MTTNARFKSGVVHTRHVSSTDTGMAILADLKAKLDTGKGMNKSRRGFDCTAHNGRHVFDERVTEPTICVDYGGQRRMIASYLATLGGIKYRHFVSQCKCGKRLQDCERV